MAKIAVYTFRRLQKKKKMDDDTKIITTRTNSKRTLIEFEVGRARPIPFLYVYRLPRRKPVSFTFENDREQHLF